MKGVNIHDIEGRYLRLQCSEYVENQEIFVRLRFGKLLEIVDFRHELNFNW